ncbi:hypothetical protein DICSQDRAFT_62192, partial [Dichomitus squalens LYAD-421 SS1]
MSSKLSSTPHEPEDDACECSVCVTIREESGCTHPISCMKRATRILDTLSPRWDPRGTLLEDYEDNESDEDQMENGEIDLKNKVTTHGTISEIFRIF